MRKAGYILTLLILMLSSVADLSAQTRRPRRDSGQGYGMRIEKKVVLPDSATLARRDSIHLADSVHRADSVALLGKSSLEVPAFSNARDSIVEDFSDGKKIIYYYGEVSVKYQNIELSAEYMEYDLNSGTVFAKGVYDSINAEWIGRPVMIQDGQEYNMEEVRYNFNSGKARITNMSTTADEGIIHGRNIKMMDDKSINLTNGLYTVCDAPTPHYSLHLTSGKMIGNKTIFGPAYLEVEEVKIPFIGLPFGFTPERPKRATGLLMPTFGEEASRGFYIRDLGMYFVFGDHLDLSVTGSWFTLGSWSVDVNSRYKVNYKFNGSFSLNYANNQTGEKGTDEFFKSTDFGVRWTHTQDSKSHPGTTFSASVNFSSPSNNRYNSHSLNEAIQNQISSSVSYSKNWNGKFSLSMNLLHSQSTRDSSYTFTLPNITFSMSTIYPFKRKNRVGKERFYEKISFGYNTSLQNKISFKASEFRSPDLIDRFQNGMAHNFSIGLPSMMLLKYINLSPSVSYSQNWFFRKREYGINPETGLPEQLESHQFNTFGITQNYSFGASMSTRLYGMLNFKKHHKVQAIRHVISPSLSMSLSPDKGTYANGYRTLGYIDEHGKPQEYQYNIYQGQMYGPPGRGKSATASLSIGNTLEAKVKDYADTTGKGVKKVKLIDQLSLNTSYNFLADSMKMSTVSMSMSTTLFNKIGIQASASFDPYAIAANGRPYNMPAFLVGQGLLRLQSISASTSYSWSGEGKIDGDDGSGQVSTAGFYQRRYNHPVTGEYIPGGWLYYTNPNVPWSINLNASFSMTKTYLPDPETLKLVSKNNILATVNASGNIRLTPKMNISVQSGFDIAAMKLTSTSLNVSYDLHCFNISVQWIPLGNWKSYSFRIAANASTLADILQFRKSDSYWDN